MDHTVAHSGFMNKTRLGVRDTKTSVRAVSIRLRRKTVLKQSEIMHKTYLKVRDIATKMLTLYVEWHTIMLRHIPKDLRYSLAIRIDSLFAQVLEGISLAQFATLDLRARYLTEAIGKNDTLKFMLYALNELKGIDESKFISLSVKTEEIGRMLYGWKLSVEKKTAGRGLL